MSQVVKSVTEQGFVPYATSVGGSGLGILSPYRDGEEEVEDIRTVEGDRLSSWAESKGRWLFT